MRKDNHKYIIIIRKEIISTTRRVVNIYNIGYILMIENPMGLSDWMDE